MPKSHAELKRAIHRSKKSASGRRRYSTALRSEIVEAARAARAGGQTVTQIAVDLDLGDQLLGTWLRKAAGPTPIRPVEVVADERTPEPRLRLVLPSGAAVEGLSLDDIRQLVRSGR